MNYVVCEAQVIEPFAVNTDSTLAVQFAEYHVETGVEGLGDKGSPHCNKKVVPELDFCSSKTIQL